MKEKWKKIKERFWPPGKDQLLILVLLGLLLAVIAVPVEKDGDGEENAKNLQTASDEENGSGEAGVEYEERMERKLEELLDKVEGVGEVRVMLTFVGSGEKIVEKDTSATADSSSEETVYEESGSSVKTPYVTAETNPQVEGVLIVAEGGGDSRVKQEILEAAQALFGIEAHKIKIMKMEETQ